MTVTLYIVQKNLDGTTLSPFHSTVLCHLSGNFAFHPPAALLPVGAQSCSTDLLQSSWNQKFLSNDRNWVYWTKWPHERARSGEYCRWITTALPGWKPFPWSPKTNVGSHLILKLQNLLLMNSGFFPSEGVFRWSDSRQYLLPLTCWVSTENSYCRTPSAILSGANQQPTLDSRDGWDVSARQRQLWLDFLYISSCMHVFAITRWWDIEHLYFWSTDLQNSNANVQNDFLAIEQKSLITPPQPTSPTYCKINNRQWAGQIARKKWIKMLLDIPLSTTLDRKNIGWN